MIRETFWPVAGPAPCKYRLRSWRESQEWLGKDEQPTGMKRCRSGVPGDMTQGPPFLNRLTFPDGTKPELVDSLFDGARVFVHIPGSGYVGYGTVSGEARPVTEFTVEHKGENRLPSEFPLQAENVTQQASDPENQEYFVPIKWEDTVERSDAEWEKGMFANQDIVCKSRNRLTRDRLAEYFEWEA